MLTGEVAAEADQGGSWLGGMLVRPGEVAWAEVEWARPLAEAKEELLLTEDELLDPALEPRPLEVMEDTPGLVPRAKEPLRTAALANCFWYSGSAGATTRTDVRTRTAEGLAEDLAEGAWRQATRRTELRPGCLRALRRG